MPDCAAALDPSLESLGTLAPWLKNVSPPPGGLYLAGGTIRDMLLGRRVKDCDVVCRGARTFAAALAQIHRARFVPLGQDHDPPSFRVVSMDGHRNYIDVTELFGPDIESDLARRDFTANALALRLDVHEAIVIDPFHGRRDINQGLVRQVSPSSLQDDPARILRGFRLCAQLGWSIEPATLQNMTATARMLAQTAGERIALELRLILECPGASRTIREMAQSGVLNVLFPELAALRGCLQNDHHHLDVFDHSLAALECCEAMLGNLPALFGDFSPAVQDTLAGWRLPWLKLAVLLHDLGKPRTLGHHPRPGQVTFYGHDALGAQIALEAVNRLRLSRAEGEYIAGLIRHHLHMAAILTSQATARARTRLLRRIGPDVIPSVLLCLADTRAALGPASSHTNAQTTQDQALRLIKDSLGQARETLSAPPLLSGHDLLEMGLLPGPGLGRVLKALREAQDVGDITTRDEALRFVQKNYPLSPN